MAYGSADLLETMVATEHLSVPALRVDGGAAANDWLMQFQADVLGVPVERPDLVETTALGAAGLAGLALGVWESTDQFVQTRKFTRFEPEMDDAQRRMHKAGWVRAVDAALAWARAR
jgi:glycerol kinase